MKCLSNLKFVHEVIVVLVVVILGFCGLPCSSDYTKECTNIPQLTSHTKREQLLNSNNETLKLEVYSHYHLTPTDDSAWSGLIPRKVLKEKDDEFYWSIMYRQLKNQAGLFSVPGSLLKAVSLHNVRLDAESFHGRAQQTNLEYLLMLDPDRLVWSFRKASGLPTPGTPYGGWESPTEELRGHFVGHYMSASAQMWASTHNDILREKMFAVVSSLSDCQDKLGTGYLSAFPSEFFDRFEAVKPVWAPYYTIHKILAGLLDQHEFAGNGQALKMATRMVEYFYNRVQNVILRYSITRHWKSLNEETGGMNDVLYRLYSITGNQKHLLLAHLFDKPCFLGLLAVQADDLANFHANTHIPIVIGSQRRYEVTGDRLDMAIGTFFMDIVNTSHSYATGGTSVSEFWSDPKRLASTLETENQESCTTYNMLKVSRNLFRWSKDVEYADYYERALTNGVLGIQRGQDPGIMIYMLPLGRGVSKAASYHSWGTRFNSFWCCYGTGLDSNSLLFLCLFGDRKSFTTRTCCRNYNLDRANFQLVHLPLSLLVFHLRIFLFIGIESFSKLGDSIYFEEEGSVPGLYIIQYISSSLDWKSGQMVINLKVETVSSWDPYLRVSLKFSPRKGAGQTSILNLRIPSWTSNDAKATLDGESLSVPAPGNFLTINRKWSSDNKLTLQLPIGLRTEAIKDDRPEFASIQSILFGQYVLAGLSSGDWDIKTGSAASSFSDWITSVPASYNSQLISLSQEVNDSKFVLTNTNSSITMENFPEAGTNAAVHATFRVIPKDSTSAVVSSFEDLIGKSVVLEPFDFPGMLIAHQGTGKNLVIGKPEGGKASSAFRLVKGLDGKDETVSLESENMKGCYLYSGAEYSSGTSVTLNCRRDTSDDGFHKAVSLVLNKGISQYHQISFIAKGAKRNFLLAPIMSLRDESYTVYFNIQA